MVLYFSTQKSGVRQIFSLKISQNGGSFALTKHITEVLVLQGRARDHFFPNFPYPKFFSAKLVITGMRSDVEKLKNTIDENADALTQLTGGQHFGFHAPPNNDTLTRNLQNHGLERQDIQSKSHTFWGWKLVWICGVSKNFFEFHGNNVDF